MAAELTPVACRALDAALLARFTPLRDTIECGFETGPSQLESFQHWAETDPRARQPATVAKLFDNGPARRFHILTTLGMMVRLIDAQIEGAGSSAALDAARRRAQRTFDEASSRLLQELSYSVIPIRKLVSVQLGTALLSWPRGTRGLADRRLTMPMPCAATVEPRFGSGPAPVP